MAFVEGFSLKRPFFPFSRGKNRISQGVENRGTLISVPLALRVEEWSVSKPLVYYDFWAPPP